MLIRVGAPPKTAFNQNRPISDLIRSQVEHLKHVEERLTPEERRALPAEEIKTEAQAARYIAAMTTVLQSGAWAEAAVEIAPKVESIRRPSKKAVKKHSKQPPAAGSKLALAASSSIDKKTAKKSKKIAARATKATPKTKKKTSGRATKKAAKKTESSRSRKKR
jgi:hypothetical protein